MEQKLKEEIIKTIGRQMETPRDFDWLSNRITERTHVRLSATTLKRLFGYLDEAVKPRSFTLDVLSRFVGYKDYQNFCQEVGNLEPQSQLVLSDSLAADEIAEGQRVILTWRPDRRCVICHLGEGNFIIEQAQNTKLNIGDTFSCHLFINHEPLYLNNLSHNGEVSTLYIAGRKEGIIFEIPTTD